MKHISITFLFTILLFLDGCDKSNPVEVNHSPQSIIPLVVGNTWNFSGTSYDTLGSVNEIFGELYKVSGDTVIFGRKLTVYAGQCCANTDSGLIAYSGYGVSSLSPNDTIVSYRLVYKYPTYTGDRFNYDIRVGNVDTIINVPAGSFHCIKYQNYDPISGILYGDTYISPGFGPVKYVSYYGSYCQHNPSQLEGISNLNTYTLK